MVLRELEDAHQVLFTINKDLERKVKQRTEAIEQLIKQKDDFINQLGHDLKTPLTPLMILLPMLEKKVSSQKDKELFNIVTRNVAFMKELVNKTINLAKLNSNKISFNIESVSLAEEIKNSISINKVMFEENNITVENNVTNEIIVEADQIQLQELLNNLITNAVKYSSEEGGIIYIDSITDDESTDIIVSIRDTGIGMDDEQVRHVFNEFYKADDSRHNLDSSGLGLNICKRIVEKHGGKIWVESPGKNQGSTFYFTIKKSKTQ
jgi:signal transduction histidine kinase